MKRRWNWLLLVLALPLAVPAAAQDDQAALLRRLAMAQGLDPGAPLPGCRHARGVVEAFGARGTMESWVEPPARARMRMELGILVVETFTDGQRTWIEDRNGATRRAEAGEHSSILLAAMVETGSIFLEQPPLPVRRVIEARGDSLVMTCSLAFGEGTLELGFAPGSDRLSKMVFDDGTLVQTTTMSDWRPVAGVPVAHRSTTSLGEELEIHTELRELRVLAPRGAAFYRPGGRGPALPPASRLPASGTAGPLPFLHPGTHIFVAATLPGGREGSFLLDSGAGTNILDRGVARELGLEELGGMPTFGVGGREEARFVELDSLRIGDMVLGPQSWATLDLSAIALLFGEPIDGILGYDLFRQVVVDIDYGTRELRLHDPARYQAPPGGVELELRLDWNLPTVRAELDGEEAWLHVDTGSDGALDLAADLADELGLRPGDGPDRELAGLGGGSGSRSLQVGRLELGGLGWDDPPAHANEAEGGLFGDFRGVGILGGALFDGPGHRVVFDYSRRRLLVHPAGG